MNAEKAEFTELAEIRRLRVFVARGFVKNVPIELPTKPRIRLRATGRSVRDDSALRLYRVFRRSPGAARACATRWRARRRPQRLAAMFATTAPRSRRAARR